MKLLYVGLMVLNSAYLSAQTLDTLFTNNDSLKSKSSVVYQVEFENGGMIPNNNEVKEKFNDIYYNAVNFRIGWQTSKKNIYNSIYNYPTYGIGVYASTFNRKEIGTPYAVYGFISVPFKLESSKRFHFDYRIGLGMAFNFRPFDPEKNPVNILLSTAENVFIDAGVQMNYKIYKHLDLGVGLSFHHFSNGSIRQPNKGINLVPLALHLRYTPNPISNLEKQVFVREKLSNRNAYHFSFAGGLKQMNISNRAQFFKSTIGIYYSRQIAYKWRLGAGADMFYSSTGLHEEISNVQNIKVKSILSGGPALYIDHVLNSNLYINSNVGYYVHRNTFNGEVKPIFLRIGLRYKFNNNMFAGASIKAHRGKADFVEWTMGYSIFK